MKNHKGIWKCGREINILVFIIKIYSYSLSILKSFSHMLDFKHAFNFSEATLIK